MKRALVIGGSLGGLLAAHLLRGAGWHPSVFEGNAEELTGRGVGLGTHPQLIAALRRAGIAFDETMGVKVLKIVYLDRSGKIAVEQPTARTMSERLVAALSRASRRAAATRLPPRQKACSSRARRRGRYCSIRRRLY